MGRTDGLRAGGRQTVHYLWIEWQLLGFRGYIASRIEKLTDKMQIQKYKSD